MRNLEDPNNEVLQEIVDALVSENVDVSAREIARRHPRLKHASAFTRSADRKAIIDQAQRRQVEARQIAAQISLPQSGPGLPKGDQTEIAALQKKIHTLVAAHAGLIRSVQLAGGMAALERFWSDYKAIGDTVDELGAGARGAEIVPISRAK